MNSRYLILVFVFFFTNFKYGLGAEQKVYKNKYLENRVFTGLGFDNNSMYNLHGLYRIYPNKSKWDFYAGLRITSYQSATSSFYTADPKISTGNTGFAAIYAKKIPANLDTFNSASSKILSYNLSVHINYKISDAFFKLAKLYLEGNVDVLGITMAKTIKGNLIQNGKTLNNIAGEPTNFNRLGGGANNKGCLNSEFVIRAALGKRDKLAVHFGISNTVQEITIKSSGIRYRSTNIGSVVGIRLKIY